MGETKASPTTQVATYHLDHSHMERTQRCDGLAVAALHNGQQGRPERQQAQQHDEGQRKQDRPNCRSGEMNVVFIGLLWF